MADIQGLNVVIQFDIDAARAYDQAIAAIAEPEIRERLAAFKGDHERHVTELSAAVRRLGGTPPEQRDPMGFFIEGFTAASGVAGTAGALAAMRGNELLTNSIYEQAQTYDVPEDVKQILQRGLADEQRHAHYIQRVLEGRRPEE